MPRPVRVYLAAGGLDDRVNAKKALLSAQGVEIAGETGRADEIVGGMKETSADILLLDGALEGGADGLAVAEEVAIKAPTVEILFVSDRGDDPMVIRRAMLAGVRQVVAKPYEPDVLVQLVQAVGEIHLKKEEVIALAKAEAEGAVTASKTVTVFSTKGGVGRSLIATNLAIALKIVTEKKVCLVDLDLQFGDVAVMTHLKPRGTIANLVAEFGEGGEIDDETLMRYVMTHEESGLSILPAPLRPDEADSIKANHIHIILQRLQKRFHYIVVDTPNYLSDTVLTSLELSDTIILLLAQELPTIKNGKLMLEIMKTLGYPKEKIKIVLNRFDEKSPFTIKDIEETLEHPIEGKVPSEGMTVMPAVNEGTPFLLRSGEKPISLALLEIARTIAGADAKKGAAAIAPAKKSGFAALFGGGGWGKKAAAPSKA